MDRTEWLAEKRREVEERYSSLWAPRYGVTLGLYSNATHLQFLHRFLSLLPRAATVLDAACGAGRYLPILLQEGHTPLATDQSEGMLARTRTLFPGVRVQKVGLQEMAFEGAFDGAICMDAMENVSPEGWPTVLGNFHRALKPRGHLYFTVEIASEADIEQAFQRGQQAGLPIVYGEWPDGDVYHFYPRLLQVHEWIREAGLELVDEGQGDEYHHLILQKSPARSGVLAASQQQGRA
jgi:SAM-dependent methyltransferase